MDDSSMFMEWAMETLQNEHPAADDAFPLLQELPCSELQQKHAEAVELTNSWSSGAVLENDDGWSSNYPQPVSWQFTSAMPLVPPSIHVQPAPPRAQEVPELVVDRSPPAASRRRSSKSKSAAATGNTSPEPCVQEHVMAERKRREKINRRFIELSTVIPGLKKMDKGTILLDAVRYIKQQQEKLRELEDRNVRRSDDSVVLVTRPGIATSTDGSTMTGSLPEIEVRITERNVMLKIHCQDGKGVLVRLLTEVEGLHLTLTHNVAIPFPDCTVNITITAKVDEGFNIAAEDIVGKLDAALRC